MQAVILVGGEGTRLRPLTYTVPKPALPLANRPFVSYMVNWLAGHGVDDVVMACGFLADKLRVVLGDDIDGIRIRYVTEPEPRGTGGAVKFVQELLDQRFFVLNGDVLTDFDLSAVRRVHEQRNAKATLSLIPVDDPTAYGLVRTVADGEIEAFLEKPQPEQIDTDQINAGAYVIEREVIEQMADDRTVSFERETFPALIGNGLYGVRVEGYWLDIGTAARYLQATRDILNGTVETSVEPTADAGLVAPSLVGANCEIAAGATVGPLACLGAGCKVGAGATVERSALHDGVDVAAKAVVRDSIVGAEATIGVSAIVENETIVAARTTVDARKRLSGGRVER